MPHADTLRNREKWLSVAQSIAVERSYRDALLAGAAAIDTAHAWINEALGETP